MKCFKVINITGQFNQLATQAIPFLFLSQLLFNKVFKCYLWLSYVLYQNNILASMLKYGCLNSKYQKLCIIQSWNAQHDDSIHHHENQMQLHYSTLFNTTTSTANNNNEFLCMNIIEDQAQWRDKTKGLSNLVII